jgi:hypothetical protein
MGKGADGVMAEATKIGGGAAARMQFVSAGRLLVGFRSTPAAQLLGCSSSRQRRNAFVCPVQIERSIDDYQIGIYPAHRTIAEANRENPSLSSPLLPDLKSVRGACGRGPRLWDGGGL